MNSYILTGEGISLLIGGKAFAVEKSHINYDEILDCIRAKDFASIPALIDVRETIREKFAAATNELTIEGDEVLFRGTTLSAVITDRIMEMFNAGFDLTPMSNFLTKLYANPSKKAVDELFGWISMNGITISEDGFLYAYKRVQDDFTSFHDNKTMNAVGTYVEMPRNEVDDRSENTCSQGLHFCSQAYLPHYCGGQGQVLLLKIDPADVVSIPTDYDNAKGRACRYLVESVIRGDARQTVETNDVLRQTVIRDAEDVSESNEYKSNYRLGYKDGRGKQRKFKSVEDFLDREWGYDPSIDSDDAERVIETWEIEYPEQYEGYEAGFADGKAKAPKRFV